MIGNNNDYDSTTDNNDRKTSNNMIKVMNIINLAVIWSFNIRLQNG